MRRFFVFLIAAGVMVAPVFAKEHAAQSAPHFATELPFHDCDGLICIDVVLDGAKPRTLMLDTGNAHSTVITDVARELGWSLEPLQRDGKPVPGIYRGGEHRTALGGVEAKTNFFVFDRDLLGEYKPPVDGSITYDFFKDRILQIDYPAHRLRISDIVTTPVAEHASKPGTLKLITFGEHGPPIVVGAPFTVNGKRLRAQIDTCYTGTLLVYDSAVAKLDLTKQGKPELVRYTDGGVNMLAALAQSIGFGTQIIAKNPTLYFVGEGKNPVHQPDGLFEGTVGNALFAHSIVTLDFHAMTLDVKPAQ
jgi:hypothetical protein